MADLLKNMYNPAFFERLTPVLTRHIPNFNEYDFIVRVFDNKWSELELKGRIRQISVALHYFLKDDYKKAAEILSAIANDLDRVEQNSFPYIFLADYIECFGVQHPDISLSAMEEVTKFVSCEFAVRPFLLRYPEITLKQLMKWASHKHQNVRRLASEGCRPRLPWGKGVPLLKKAPARIVEILELLKNDPSEFVRRSVANNLHDIGKDHPALLLEICKAWAGRNEKTAWIIRHACRTLLKKGNREALILHGLNPDIKGKVRELSLNGKRIKVGESLDFDFEFLSLDSKLTTYRIEYAIDYKTSTGRTSTKIFKIAERTLDAGERIQIHRRQSFRDLTTRKHHKGKHKLNILGNGQKLAEAEFIVC